MNNFYCFFFLFSFDPYKGLGVKDQAVNDDYGKVLRGIMIILSSN